GRGDLAEDDHQDHREGDAAVDRERRPASQPGLVEDDLAERGAVRRPGQRQVPRPGQPGPGQYERDHAAAPSWFRWLPVSLTKASSRFEESSWTSRADTPAACRARITALTSSPVPVTTTCWPACSRPVTSGRSVSSRSSNGADGRNRTVLPPRARSARAAGVPSAT